MVKDAQFVELKQWVISAQAEQITQTLQFNVKRCGKQLSQLSVVSSFNFTNLQFDYKKLKGDLNCYCWLINEAADLLLLAENSNIFRATPLCP